MEYLEILLPNIINKCIDLIVRDELRISNNQMISSHFYDKRKMKDITFSEVSNFSDYFAEPNTGNIFLRELFLGEEISEVMIILSFDEKIGDITLNFGEDAFINVTDKELKNKIGEIVKHLIKLQFKYDVQNIRFGYEPVIDDDNVILVINDGNVAIDNKFPNNLGKIATEMYTNI